LYGVEFQLLPKEQLLSPTEVTPYLCRQTLKAERMSITAGSIPNQRDWFRR
jgi:hypothetical protein